MRNNNSSPWRLSSPLLQNQTWLKLLPNLLGFISLLHTLWKAKCLRIWLKFLSHALEIPLHTYFNMKISSDLYEQEKIKFVDKLSKSSSVALTINGWTSRAMESYLLLTTSLRSGRCKVRCYSHVPSMRVTQSQMWRRF